MSKIFVYDLDKTLCEKRKNNETYADVKPIQENIDILNKLYDEGNTIIISTARNMLTQNNDICKVIKNVGEITLKWLRENNVKYHSINFGKPYGSCYIDDKSIRPNELLELNKINMINELDNYLENENYLPILNRNLNMIFEKYCVYQWFYFENNKKHVFFVGYSNKLKNLYIDDINFKAITNNHECKVEIKNIFDNKEKAVKYKKELIKYYLDNDQCELFK